MAGGSALIRGHSQAAIWMHLQSLREEKKNKKNKKNNKKKRNKQNKTKNLGSLLAGHCKSLRAVHFHSSMPAVIKSDSTLFIFGGFVQTPAEERKKPRERHGARAATANAAWAVLLARQFGRDNPSSGTRYHKYQAGNRDIHTPSVLKQILNPAKEQRIRHHFFSAFMIDCQILRIAAP